MKKYIYILVFLGLATSCNMLDEKNEGLVAPETYYKTVADLETATIPIYWKLESAYFRSGGTDAIALGADDVTTSASLPEQVEFEIFQPSGSNSWVANWWVNCYQGILAANNIFANSVRVPESTDKNYIMGQAYFARAWFYFLLVRTHNRVPLITDINTHPDISNSEPQEIYKLIVEDLKKAEVLLPDKWTNYKANIAFTSGIAKSALSLVYLTMAGYPINDVSKYALAADKAKEVIDNADKYGYKLLTNFADLWTYQTFNSETILGAYYNTALGEENHSAPLCSAPSEYNGWDYYFAELNFYKKFPSGPRKDATFWTKFPILNADKTVTTKDWTEMKQKHPYYKKYIEVPGYDWSKPWITSNWNSSRTNVILRYAEVLLIYAEAKAMSGTADATAYSAINLVRKRAGTKDLVAGLSQTAFRDSVIAERAWEFAGLEPNESRWFDLVRLQRVEAAALDRDASELKILVAPTKKSYFSPLPDGEILKNPNLGK